MGRHSKPWDYLLDQYSGYLTGPVVPVANASGQPENVLVVTDKYRHPPSPGSSVKSIRQVIPGSFAFRICPGSLFLPALGGVCRQRPHCWVTNRTAVRRPLALTSCTKPSYKGSVPRCLLLCSRCTIAHVGRCDSFPTGGHRPALRSDLPSQIFYQFLIFFTTPGRPFGQAASARY